jgi:hypothetical protein
MSCKRMASAYIKLIKLISIKSNRQNINYSCQSYKNFNLPSIMPIMEFQ